MSLGSNDMSVADIAAVMNGGGMGGGNGLWWLFVLFLFGRGGWGGYGMGGAGLQGMATRADINEGFALQGITSGIQGIQQSVSDASHGLSAQLAQCCCDNRMATADLKYTIGSEFCHLGNTVQNVGRDIIDNQNANYRGIMDFLVQEKLASKDARIAELSNQLSQSQQNGVIRAAIDASTAEIIRRTGHDYPTPSYWVSPPTPVPVPYQSCGCGCAA